MYPHTVQENGLKGFFAKQFIKLQKRDTKRYSLSPLFTVCSSNSSTLMPWNIIVQIKENVNKAISHIFEIIAASTQHIIRGPNYLGQLI